MKENDKGFEIFIEFIRYEAGLKDDFEINLVTSIEEDLGVTGMEAVELIEKFSEVFNVDISCFTAKLYFHPEFYWGVEERIIRPFTVGDLYLAALLGKLDDKNIGN
ncbi:DUF1493 family protein [Mucilaginibacter pedocola]|uniref:Acyl carrier protein n=1 Tax=Mucilaginibacter pedocola TaxID=1792845 RepID=A0A1S9P8Z5_9SPHI|nr:DUF1493 family protein [Mucilaginibacter pedocola]OOQ57422.1 hypothetical protein BC343_15100 [Mucilaginibacter pedocola]